MLIPPHLKLYREIPYKMKVHFQIQRHIAGHLPWVETFELEASPNTTILECLNQIKWEQDGSLAFRKNCRNTICGSCAIRINGRPALACKQTLHEELNQAALACGTAADVGGLTTAIEIQPLHNFPIIKDLVVEMGEFWQNLAKVDPYVSTAARIIPEREFLQSPLERTMLNQVGNCIMCGACYSECNAKSVTSEFVGPHALAKAYRVLADTRDDHPQERLDQYTQGLFGVWGCTRCFNCNTVCPMDVAPLDQITRIKENRLAQAVSSEPRSIRHRRTMLALVSQGGWVNERRFGLEVVGNRFRDLEGLWSLIPLGVRMMVKGKFPAQFEPSQGTQTVGALIQAAAAADAAAIQQTFFTQGLSSVTQVPQMPNSPHTPAHSEDQSLDSTQGEPELGWSPYAEKINGRFAMIGFVILLMLEIFTHQTFLEWLGL
jgi:succinate dehydrogenase / fumarate reductase, iron-sulfur subunit